jgi:RNA polymerase sigma-70 factor (ECF subfamily)
VSIGGGIAWRVYPEPMPEVTDELLATRVQEGQEEPFATLIERYQAKLLRYARKFLLDPDDAEDIVQDIFIKAYQNIQSFDVTRRFSPWIYRIAHNEFVNEIKKRYARRTVFVFDMDTLFPHLTAPDTADSAAMDRDLRETLEKHLDSIDPKYREPLVLYYLEGMNYKEISEIMQIPVSTVGVRLARARAILQQKAGSDPSLLS